MKEAFRLQLKTMANCLQTENSPNTTFAHDQSSWDTTTGRERLI